MGKQSTLLTLQGCSPVGSTNSDVAHPGDPRLLCESIHLALCDRSRYRKLRWCFPVDDIKHAEVLASLGRAYSGIGGLCAEPHDVVQPASGGLDVTDDVSSS